MNHDDPSIADSGIGRARVEGAIKGFHVWLEVTAPISMLPEVTGSLIDEAVEACGFAPLARSAPAASGSASQPQQQRRATSPQGQQAQQPQQQRRQQGSGQQQGSQRKRQPVAYTNDGWEIYGTAEQASDGSWFCGDHQQELSKGNWGLYCRQKIDGKYCPSQLRDPNAQQ